MRSELGTGIVVAFCFSLLALGCSSGSSSHNNGTGNNNNNNTPPAADVGSYNGSYSGAESGTTAFSVASNGALSGTLSSPSLGVLGVSGTVNSTGGLSLTAGSLTFAGTVSNGSASGTWTSTTTGLTSGGTFTALIVSTGIPTADIGSYSGTYSGAESGNVALSVDSNGNVTGSIASPSAAVVSMSGSLTSAGALSFTGGTFTFSGTVTNGAASGTWTSTSTSPALGTGGPFNAAINSGNNPFAGSIPGHFVSTVGTDSGTFTFVITSNGALTCNVVFPTGTASLPGLCDGANGVVTSSNGGANAVSFSGTLTSLTTGSGVWNNPARGTSGTWSCP